ncbi:hypothetical protein B4080_5986 [Bacillus cereus]|nr:hypothetical protein B4080_5986 [Bacillus cereus]
MISLLPQFQKEKPQQLLWFFLFMTKTMLQDILNHSTPQITLKYIGINKEEKDNILDVFHI